MDLYPPEKIFSVFENIGLKWNSRVVVALGSRRRRFNDLRREIDGLTQRMLTRTLRALERDGLVKRTVVESLQSHVDYELTPLGLSALSLLQQIITWIEENAEQIRDAQIAFDQRNND